MANIWRVNIQFGLIVCFIMVFAAGCTQIKPNTKADAGKKAKDHTYNPETQVTRDVVRHDGHIHVYEVRLEINKPNPNEHKPDKYVKHWWLTDPKKQQDFPDMALSPSGKAWMVFIQYDGKEDVLKLARHTGKGIEVVSTIGKPGVINQPRIICDAKGRLWVSWAQLVNGIYISSL